MFHGLPWQMVLIPQIPSHLISMPGQIHAQLARLDVPHLQGAVTAAAHQEAAVRRPGHLVH